MAIDSLKAISDGEGDHQVIAQQTLDAIATLAAIPVQEPVAITLVKRNGEPQAAYPRRLQAEVYASGFSKNDGLELIDGVFYASPLPAVQQNPPIKDSFTTEQQGSALSISVIREIRTTEIDQQSSAKDALPDGAREAFELWYRNEYWDFKNTCPDLWNGSRYNHLDVQLAWKAWQAALLTRQAVPEWLPIETAPKTGRTILLGAFNKLGNWRTMRGQYFTQQQIDDEWEEPDFGAEGWYETAVEADDTPNCWSINPTHWMPLPAAPVAVQSKEGE
ncbi:MAG: hypothetical protein ACXU8A_00045 [Burkholderiaceae bacterium]